ncbi:putative Peptidase M20 dimerization domain-containing protein [Seiridium cardinale]
MSDAPLHPTVALLKALIDIDSTSEKEHEIGLFLTDHLNSLGYTVERIAIFPGSTRHNVYAYLGQQRKARLLVTCHMDTVPPHIPFSIEGDIIRGRGACDDLGPLVSQVMAIEELRAEEKIGEGDVSFLFVVGEEKGGPGMIAANDMGLEWEAGLFGEPTEGKLGSGHKGHVVFELSARGKACHSGYPHRGKSAVSTLLKALNDLECTTWPFSEILGPSTLNIGKVEGGEGYNILAGTAKALCGIRVAVDTQKIKLLVMETVAKHADVEINFLFEYGETYLECDIEGFESVPLAYGTDIPRLHGSHKKVLYGPGSILVAHGPDEHIRVSELIESVTKNKILASKLLGL